MSGENLNVDPEQSMRAAAKEIASVFGKLDFSFIDESKTLLQVNGSLDQDVEPRVVNDFCRAPKHPDHSHALQRQPGSGVWRCDVCGSETADGHRYHCASCDWGACIVCMGGIVDSETYTAVNIFSDRLGHYVSLLGNDVLGLMNITKENQLLQEMWRKEVRV